MIGASEQSVTALKLSLNHLADDFAGTTLQPSEQQKQLVYGVDCGRGHLLLSNETTCEVVADAQCSPLPNAPDALIGLHVNRGDLIPVYRIDTALQSVFEMAGNGIEECGSESIKAVSRKVSGQKVDGVIIPLLFLLGKGEDRVGVVLHGLPQVYDLTLLQSVSSITGFSPLVNQYTQKTFHVDQQWWLLFDWLGFLKQLSES